MCLILVSDQFSPAAVPAAATAAATATSSSPTTATSATDTLQCPTSGTQAHPIICHVCLFAQRT